MAGTGRDSAAGVREVPEVVEGPERLVALSDAIYAIAMTLLVLDISVPDGLDEAGFRHAMRQAWSGLGAYALSFTVLAAFWRDQRRLFNQVRGVDTLTLRLTLASLGAVALVPFPTALLSQYGGSEPLAVSVYATLIALISLLHLAVFLTVWRHRRLQTRPIPTRAGWTGVIELSAIVPVCAASSVMAYAVSPRAGLLSWLLAIPLKQAFRWYLRTQRRA